jgi:hypothetical protein
LTTAQETVTANARVVDVSTLGAERLARSYWQELESTTRGLVRAREYAGGIELRLLDHGPALIRLGPPTLLAENGVVSCMYPIAGGLLVGRPGGMLVFEQRDGSPVVISSRLTEYLPRLARRGYALVQARIHSRVSRRHLARLIREAE